MPQRSQTTKRLSLEQRIDQILEANRIMDQGKNHEDGYRILLRLTPRQRQLARLLRHLKDHSSLQKYLVDLIEKDAENFLPSPVKERLEEKLALSH